MLLAASLPAAAAHHGRVFVDKNHNGSFDKGEKVLKDVKAVSYTHLDVYKRQLSH